MKVLLIDFTKLILYNRKTESERRLYESMDE